VRLLQIVRLPGTFRIPSRGELRFSCVVEREEAQ
jgi:hypothetical protein